MSLPASKRPKTELQPSARSAIFTFLRALTRSKPDIAALVLGPEMLLKLVGAMMPGRDALSRYEWDELPLRLVADEIAGCGAQAQSVAVLYAVLRDGGAYDNFDACKRSTDLANPPSRPHLTQLRSGRYGMLLRPAARGLLCRYANRPPRLAGRQAR